MSKVLANSTSKSNLTAFIAAYLRINLPSNDALKQDDKKVLIAGAIDWREDALVITKNSQCIDFNFKSNHLEANTRIIYHIIEIDKRNTNNMKIVVETPDTDIFLLLIHHYLYFTSKPLIWMKTGTVVKHINKRRFIPIHKIYEVIGNR